MIDRDNIISSYRWNPFRERVEFWSVRNDCWMFSHAVYGHNNNPDNIFINTSFSDTWAEPTYEDLYDAAS